MTQRPIAHDLVRTTDEERLHDAWRGVRTRMRRRPATRARRMSLALAAVALVGVAVYWAWPGSVPGPLHHASGAALHAAESVAEPRVLHLADRSTIELGVGARVEPRRNDAERLELDLVRGRARFEVTPGGPREWVIVAGLATVRVLGTAFVVDREDRRLVVEVERGRVRVEGELVPGGRRVLGAGDRLVLDPPTPPERERDETAPAPPAPETEPVAALEDPTPAPASEAREAPPRRAEPSTDPETLLGVADTARREGRFADAAAPLESILRHHPDHPEAPLAAITLARLQQGPLHDPTAALRSLRLARRLGVPRLFDAEVCSSMALVLETTGDLEGARAEAQQCLGRHSTPPHTERLRRLAEAP